MSRTTQPLPDLTPEQLHEQHLRYVAELRQLLAYAEQASIQARTRSRARPFSILARIRIITTRRATQMLAALLELFESRLPLHQPTQHADPAQDPHTPADTAQAEQPATPAPHLARRPTPTRPPARRAAIQAPNAPTRRATRRRTPTTAAAPTAAGPRAPRPTPARAGAAPNPNPHPPARQTPRRAA